MVLTLAAGPASRIWFASAAIRYRMLAAGLVSSAEMGSALSDRTCARHFPSGFRQRSRRYGEGSGGGDEPVDGRGDLGGLLFGNPVSAVGDDAGGHVVSAGFAQAGRHLGQHGGVTVLGERQLDRGVHGAGAALVAGDVERDRPVQGEARGQTLRPLVSLCVNGHVGIGDRVRVRGEPVDVAAEVAVLPAGDQ